jgi:hypothetical protein
MQENIPWLFYAYGFGWGRIFLYLFWISRRERALRKQIATLQAILDKRDGRA